MESTYVNYLNTRGDFLSILKIKVESTYVNYLNTRGDFLSILKIKVGVNLCQLLKYEGRLFVHCKKLRWSQLQCGEAFNQLHKNEESFFCQFFKTKAKSTSMWRTWQSPISINRGGVNFNVCYKAFYQFLKIEVKLFANF